MSCDIAFVSGETMMEGMLYGVDKLRNMVTKITWPSEQPKVRLLIY